MSVDEEMIAQALAALGRKAKAGVPVTQVMDDLAEAGAPFEDLDEDDLEDLARAVLARLGPSAPLPRAMGSGGGRGGAQTGSGSSRPKSDVEPSAPFRFVGLADRVVKAGPPPALDLPLADGFTARIDVVWAAETPLLIGQEDTNTNTNTNTNTKVVEPLKLGSEYVIPGATFRGLLRSATEIVTFGRLGAANLHHRFGLRDFEHPYYSERSPVSKVDEVKAGWLDWPGGEDKPWRLTAIGSNWAHILADDLTDWGGRGRASWIGMSLRDKYQTARMARGDIVDFRPNGEFSPPAADPYNRKAVKPKTGGRRGTLVFSGKLPGKDGNKKYEYVFFDAPGETYDIKPEIVADFLRLSCRPARNRFEPDGSFKELYATLKSGGRVPVFFVGDPALQGETFFFGLTRLFKIPHQRSVGTLLRDSQPAHLDLLEPDERGVAQYKADLVDSLFGYVVEPDEIGRDTDNGTAPDAIARKGRIAFSFGRLTAESRPRATLTNSLTAILMAPRASYAPFYLRGSGEKDYSAAIPPKLAGRKRYRPRRAQGMSARDVWQIMERMAKGQIDLIADQQKRPVTPEQLSRIGSTMRFLTPKTGGDLAFESTITLHNVTAAELGAVLFALTHGGDPSKPYRHMIGRARAFGAGQMRVASARLTVEANGPDGERFVQPPAAEELVSADGMTGFAPAPQPDRPSASHRPFLEHFAEAMRKAGRPQPGAKGTAAGEDLSHYPKNLPPISEFLGTAEPAPRGAAQMDYMPLGNFSKIRGDVKSRKGAAPGRPGPAPSRKEDRLLPTPTRPPFWR